MTLHNRRQFLTGAVATVSGLITARESLAKVPEKALQSLPEKPAAKFDLMTMVKKYRKIDSHAHVYFNSPDGDAVIDIADRLFIETLSISRPMVPGGKGDPKEFIEANNLVLRCYKKHPTRFLPQMTLNPQFQKESLDEINRCVDAGMVGLKLYNHVKMNDPLFYPVIEKFIDLKMVILMHMGIGKARINYDSREPANVSIPGDIVEAAKRYPEATFQLAHLGGGIDWEDACKAVQDVPNIYVDLSGSNNEARIVDCAMKYVGEDRLLFACDNSFYQGVGHILAAQLTDVQRKKIFFDNYNNLLKKIGRNVN